VILQADCATLGAEKGACAACGARAQPEAFHELASNDKLGHLARRLGMESFGTIMSAANSALGLIAYQQQLVAAKRKKQVNAKSAKLKKFKDLTKNKMKEVYSTVQKVRSTRAMDSTVVYACVTLGPAPPWILNNTCRIPCVGNLEVQTGCKSSSKGDKRQEKDGGVHRKEVKVSNAGIIPGLT
jgi:hypothetical protein